MPISTINGPVNQGLVKAIVNFNSEPPVNQYKEDEKQYLMSQGANGLSAVERYTPSIVALPETNTAGPFGLSLSPRQTHYHNFLRLQNTSGEYGYIRDKGTSVVQKYLDGPISDGDKAGLRTIMGHYSWDAIEPLYEEAYTSSSDSDSSDSDSDSSDSSYAFRMPLRSDQYISASSSSSSSLNPFKTSGASSTEKEEGMRKLASSAQWEYKLLGVPTHTFGLHGGDIDVTQDKSVKLVPFQVQKQGFNNGPSGRGVHWGLKKTINIPKRVGFFIDIYLNKDIDNPTSNTSGLSDDPTSPTHPMNFNDPDLHFAFSPDSVSYGPLFNKDAIYNGDTSYGVESNSFYLYNKSYVMIEIRGNRSKGDWFFILITSDSFPRCYRVRGTGGEWRSGSFEGDIQLLGEYKPRGAENSESPVGLNLLRGNKNHLRLQIRNVMNHIIIDNNVFNDPWILSADVFVPEDSSDALTNRTRGKTHFMTTGGLLRVYGGNISCGVSYTHLNYFKKGYLDLADFEVRGNRSAPNLMGTHFTSFEGEAHDMPIPLITDSSKTIGASSIPKTDLFYYNSARVIQGATAKYDKVILYREDVVTGGNGKSNNNPGCYSLIRAKDKVTVTDGGKFTELDTKILLRAGKIWAYEKKIDEGQSFDLGYVLPPVLQFVRQRVESVDRAVIFGTTDISDLVESIDMTWQGEDYHSVSASGSMTFNIMLPSVNAVARNSLLSSIGKARYVEIDLVLSNSEFNEGGSRFFTGIMFNPTILEEAGKRSLKYEIKDYWTILEDSLMINSPYFDGAIDVYVIEWLMRHVGFKSTMITTHVDPDPAAPAIAPSRSALGVSFSFNQPLEKLADYSAISEAIKKYSKRFSKAAFFDKYGVFRYIPLPSALFVPITVGAAAFTPKFRFYSGHYDRFSNINFTPVGVYHTDVGAPAVPTKQSQIAYNVKTTQWDNRSIYNQILLVSIDARNGGYIVETDVNWESIEDPTSYGYLGYIKLLVQKEAAFGSRGRVKLIMRDYSRMYRPPYTMQWKTIGGNNRLKPFDVVSVDGNLIMILSIRHAVDAKNNSWETDYEGQWMFPPLS